MKACMHACMHEQSINRSVNQLIKQSIKQTHKPTNKQTNKQTCIHTYIQTNTHTHTYSCKTNKNNPKTRLPKKPDWGARCQISPQSGSGDDARLLFPIWTNLAIGPRLKPIWPDCFGLARLVPDCSAWLSRAWVGRAPLSSVLLQLASTRPTSVWTGRGVGKQRSTKLP